MYTYSLTFNENIMEGAKRTFQTNDALTVWMQQQLERMLKQISAEETKCSKPLREIKVSNRIKALSAVPPSSIRSDYKDDMLEVLSEKY